MKDDKQPAARRLAFVLDAYPVRSYFPNGWIWRFPSGDHRAAHARAEAGWTSIRIDRATKARLDALRERLPELLSELQQDALDNRRAAPELSLVEMISALSTAAVKLLDAPATKPVRKPIAKKSRRKSA